MDRHGIQTSIISLANPWLDWITSAASAATPLAIEINNEIEKMSEASKGRIYGFGTIAPEDIEGSVKELERLSQMNGMKGVILGTRGVVSAVNRLSSTSRSPMHDIGVY